MSYWSRQIIIARKEVRDELRVLTYYLGRVAGKFHIINVLFNLCPVVSDDPGRYGVEVIQ